MGNVNSHIEQSDWCCILEEAQSLMQYSSEEHRPKATLPGPNRYSVIYELYNLGRVT